MANVTLSLIMQTAVLAAAPATDYPTALEASHESGRPLVILVGADWCPACERMKTNVLPEVQRTGGLRRVAFAMVNADREPQLAQKLMKGNSIPQLVMYCKTDDGWKRTEIVGATSPQAVNSFIAQGIQKSATAVATREASAGIE